MYRNIYTQMVLFEVKVLLRRNETSKLTVSKHLLKIYLHNLVALRMSV